MKHLNVKPTQNHHLAPHANEVVDPKKRPYCQPVLAEFGNIRDLTQGGTGELSDAFNSNAGFN